MFRSERNRDRVVLVSRGILVQCSAVGGTETECLVSRGILAKVRLEDRKKEWFGVTMAGSGGPVETVVLEVETVVGKTVVSVETVISVETVVWEAKRAP